MKTDAWPTIGTFNVLETSIGARGMGKSTHQCLRAWELQHETHGAYVIGHSLGGRLPPRLPPSLGGQTLPIVYHTTLDKLERGLRRHPGKWHILAPPLAGDGHRIDPTRPIETADSLLRFAVRLSTSIRKDAWQRAHPFRLWHTNVSYDGVHAPPIVIIVDEGIAVESASPSRKEDNRWFLQFLYSIRHFHIGLLYAIQDATARSWRILEQATVINVFAIHHQWALNALQAAGASTDEIERIRTQGPYEFVRLVSLDVKAMERVAERSQKASEIT